MPVKDLEVLARKIFGADRVFSQDNLEGALKRAIDDAKRPLSDDSVGIVVTGSVVTVGESRSILRRLFAKED
jgi:dihydrofolate synthase/folylpolyglutamate synthase